MARSPPSRPTQRSPNARRSASQSPYWPTSPSFASLRRTSSRATSRRGNRPSPTSQRPSPGPVHPEAELRSSPLSRSARNAATGEIDIYHHSEGHMDALVDDAETGGHDSGIIDPRWGRAGSYRPGIDTPHSPLPQQGLKQEPEPSPLPDYVDEDSHADALTQLGDRIHGLEAERDAAFEQIGDLHDQLYDARAEAELHKEYLQESLERFEDQLFALEQARRRDLTDRLKLTDEMESVRNDNDLLRNDNDLLQNDNDLLQARVAELEVQVQQAEGRGAQAEQIYQEVLDLLRTRGRDAEESAGQDGRGDERHRSRRDQSSSPAADRAERQRVNLETQLSAAHEEIAQLRAENGRLRQEDLENRRRGAADNIARLDALDLQFEELRDVVMKRSDTSVKRDAHIRDQLQQLHTLLAARGSADADGELSGESRGDGSGPGGRKRRRANGDVGDGAAGRNEEINRLRKELEEYKQKFKDCGQHRWEQQQYLEKMTEKFESDRRYLMNQNKEQAADLDEAKKKLKECEKHRVLASRQQRPESDKDKKIAELEEENTKGKRQLQKMEKDLEQMTSLKEELRDCRRHGLEADEKIKELEMQLSERQDRVQSEGRQDVPSTRSGGGGGNARGGRPGRGGRGGGAGSNNAQPQPRRQTRAITKAKGKSLNPGLKK